MKSLSSLGIWLGLVFGFLLLALGAEVYYLLWWKRKVKRGDDLKDEYNSSIRELFDVFCWKKHSSLSSTTLNSHISSQGQDVQVQLQHPTSSKDMVVIPFGEDGDVEAELKKLHNRFLFTIKEETREDLESEDGRSRDGRSRKGSRSRSLSDFLFKVDTPFMTPIPSPPIYNTSPLTPKDTYNNNHGFNPLYESSTGIEVSRIKSSPPPKFQFLIDAEEKLYKRLLIEEAQKKLQKTGGVGEDVNPKASPTSSVDKDEQDESLVTIIIDKSKERTSSNANASQVLPLASSPSRPTNVPFELLRFR